MRPLLGATVVVTLLSLWPLHAHATVANDYKATETQRRPAASTHSVGDRGTDVGEVAKAREGIVLAHPPLWQVLDDGVDRGSAWRAAVSDELPWRQGVGAFGRAATRSALAAVGHLLTGMLLFGGLGFCRLRA